MKRCVQESGIGFLYAPHLHKVMKYAIGSRLVADEVRKLAERTKEATQNISERITAIQNDSREVSQSMQDEHDAVTRGKDATDKTEEVLNAIVEEVNQAGAMIKQITVASEEQSKGAEEISKSVSLITSVSKQTEGGTKQPAKTTENLNKQISELR